MKRKLTFLISAALMLLTMMATTGEMWGQSDYSTTYTSNCTLTAGTNGSTCSVSIGNNSYDGIKVGTSKAGGTMTVTVPSGAKYLHIHVAAWNGVTGLSLNITPNTNISPTSVSLTADSGISSNSPFTFAGTASSTDYYKVITFTNALTSETTFTFTTSTTKRFVIWGVNSEEEGGGGNTPSISADDVNIAYNATSGSISYTLTNGNGNVTASVTDGDWLTLGTITESAVPFTCSANNGGERTATVTLSYTGATDKAVTVTQAGALSVAAPTFSPEAGTYTSAQNVTISTTTEGATIYYTTDGSTPTSGSTVYTSAISVATTQTIKAIAIKNEVSSAISEAEYTINIPITGYVINFESVANLYADWTFTNMESKQTGNNNVTAHGGTYYGTTGGKATASIQTKEKYSNPGNLTCYVTKQSNNTTSSTWYIQVSSDGSTWTDVETQSATSMSAGTWVEFSADLSSYSNVYVRVYYSGSTAVRNIDDLSLTEASNTFSVTYDGNGNTGGSVPTDSNEYDDGNNTVTVLGNTGNLVKAGYVWSGWNTQPNGEGTTYQANATFTITANTTLYAKWNAKTITDLSYTGTPTKTSYNSGESFDPTGLTVTATFNDESSENVTALVTWTPDPLTTGTTSVTGTYMGQTINVSGLTVTAAPGSEGNPYTVAQARAAIDAGTGLTGVYATGIISQVDSYNSTYNSITYWISSDGTTTSDQLEVYSGKGLNNTNFSSIDDVKVGATVVVYGNLKKYGNVYEFDKNNYLTSYTAPVITVEAPTFSPVAGTYDVAQSVTLSCATDGSTIYYTTDGTNPTNGSTQYTAAINVASTTTIKAIAYVGDDYSTVATATYTIVSLNNISDITEVGTAYSVKGTVVATNSKGFVMGDGTGYVYYYKNDETGKSVGDMVKVSGTTGTYGQIIQFTNSATVTEAATSSYNNTPAATTITAVPDYSTGYHLSTYLEFEGALAKSGSNYLITIGESQIQISYPTTAQSTALTALDGKTVHVKGYFTGINSSSKFTVMLESAEEVIITTPSVTITNATVNVTAVGGNGTIDVTYSNIEPDDINSVAQFFASDGETSATYDWISVEFNDEKDAVYTVEANDSEARTAYFKVYEQSEGIYSNLVTVNQAKFVVDYATLPFAFDGGSSAISSTTGLTQSGLGSDYGSSPKLKFDGTGDWVILKINERPGLLTFDIKGNSFSGSTFKVQTSEDGETYTDLKTYTELGNKQSEEFSSLGENVRYIKWIYTEKVNGNVALGNIELAAYQEQQEQVATPTFTPEAGEYNAAQNVTIACATNGATIYYTTNGDAPTAESTEYTAAIPVTTTTTIKAIAVKEGMNNSDVATATYTINTTPTPSQDNWVATDLADLTSSDVFVIVGNNGSTYAMANNNGTSAPSATAVTIANNKLSEAPADNLKWNISGNATDGYTFYPNGSTTTWLYCINNNNGLRVGDTDNDKTFEIKDDYLYNKGQGRYIGIYNSQDWRSYTNTTGNIAGQTFDFYKRVSTEPSITINPGPYNMNCDGGHAVLEVSCSNMAQNPQLEVVFYESDGTTAAAYNHDWITATIDNDGNLDGTIQLNNSNEARSAYFKIKGVGNDNSEVYSDLVTINQAAYSLSIVFETDELNIEVGGESDRKISFDYSGLGSTPTFEVRLYASDGTTSAIYDWLTTSINKNKVNITVSANTGAARHAYFKVYGAGNNTNTESNLVTINQAEYVALTYTVTYDANGGTGTMTDPNSPYTENAEVTLLENTFTAPEGKIWDSWSVKDANQETITVNNGKFNMPASNVTVSAQWVDNPVTPTYEWELTELADLTASDVFVIVGTRTDEAYAGNYAMTNTVSSSNPPTATPVEIANNKLSNAPADNLKWNISGNATDGYTFYPNGSTTNWLYCTNNNNGVRVGNNDNKTFVVDNGYLKHVSTSRYIGVYQSQDWRCYTSSTATNIANQSFAFYKKVSTEPTITATSGSNLAYDATSGSIIYEIENYEDGTMTAETTANWISNIEVDEADEMGEVTFDVTPNTSNESRSATVTLTFTYDTDKTATADVTVTQNGQPGQPSITVDPESAVVVSDGGAPEFTINYASIAIEADDDFDVQFYESNGTTTISKPDWINSATISGNTTDGFTLTVTVDPNTSAERAAYLKVYALDGDDIIYSNLITISQNEYIPPATYTLVTDIDQVVSGKHYIIASSAEDGPAYAMGAQNNNNRAGVAVTVSEANITQTGGVYEFVINGPNDGNYTIYDKINSGYLYAASSGSNHLKLETELDDNGRWSIDVDNTGVATIIAQGTNTRNNMRYNSSSTIFSCYSYGNQLDVYIYVKDDDTELEYYGDPVSLEASAFDFTHNTYSVGGTMTITGGPVANDPSSLIIQDGAQLIHESPINATVQNGVTAAPSWTSNVGGGWYFIASPVDDAVIAESILIEPFDLYKYDEPEAMWYAYNGSGAPFTTMERGIGYLHASAEEQILAFAGTMIGTETEITKTLSFTSALGDDLRGYNLMGNPYTRDLEYGDITLGGKNVTAFLGLTDDGEEYLPCNLQDDDRIRPCQGFFIQATGAGQYLVFNPAKKDRSEIGLISIKAGNEEFMDKAYIQIGGGNTLRKIAFSDNNMVYVMDGDDDYAAMTIYELANPIPVHFMAAEPGTYTITVNAKNIDLDYMHLVDEFTNEHIDLLSEPTYTFTSAEGDKPGRFTIVFGIDNVEENFESNVFAYQNEDELVVDGKGTLQIFDVLGRFVGSHEVHGSERISLSSFNTGVYVLRMVGENVKTQKIVVR
ncbi:MAG: chitobiase/beta-hexosaminidase C-terminal domain-containing protein [Bacteroidales bacterium]|nr:chitobiase/beta-hexosaminidase C-terminal domain-containing protein [Bacteroidales bacterium]